ncbi:unnamed protein product, partial [Timema podura]|nr:unnamed protein product [Timema podura]
LEFPDDAELNKELAKFELMSERKTHYDSDDEPWRRALEPEDLFFDINL